MQVHVEIESHTGQSFSDTTGCILRMKEDGLNPIVEILPPSGDRIVATVTLQDLRDAVAYMSKE